MIKLSFQSGPRAGTHLVFRHAPVVIGREADCDLVLEDDTLVSRHHAQLSWEGDSEIGLRDLGARNPTLVNESTFEGEVILMSGDMIRVGKTRMQVTRVPVPKPLHRRRHSILEWGTLAMALAFLLVQFVFLIRTAPRWRGHVDREILRPLPTPTPEPPPTPTPDPATLPPPTPTPEPTPAPPPTPTPVPLPTPIPTPVPAPTPTPIPQTEALSIAEQIAEARRLIAARRLLDADRLLAQVQAQDPNSVDAAVERARLYGQRSMFRESIGQWERVLELAPADSGAVRNAQIEIQLMRRRLETLDRPAPPPAPTPTPRPIPAPLPTRVPEAPPERPAREGPNLLLGNIDIQRFAGSELFDDMRLVSFSLRHVRGAAAAPEGTVRVEAVFYEDTGSRIERAQVPIPRVTLRIDEALSGGRILEDLEVAYEVPPGHPRGEARRFYGVVLRVLVEGREVHAISFPEPLINLIGSP